MKKDEFSTKLETLKGLGGDPMFYELLLEIAELHARKNNDYAREGDPLSNLRACERLGISAYKGILIRLQDKSARMEELVKKEAMVKNESIEDTHKDAAVYNLLAVVVRRRALDKHAIGRA